jgi:hypothetical protein
LAFFQALEGLVADARASAERAYALTPWRAEAVGLLAGIAGRQGDMARAEPLLTQLKSGESNKPFMAWILYHLVRLETDQAAEWLEKAIEQHELAVAAFHAYLRKSSRWPKLAKMMNLPETAA